jgi:hypothetical protein
METVTRNAPALLQGEGYCVYIGNFLGQGMMGKRRSEQVENNNNNKLQLGYHPVAVVILRVHKYGKKK